MQAMLSQSAAYALQSEFLPKKGAKMPRIVSGEEQPAPRNRQCLPAPEPLLSSRPPCGGGAAIPIPLPPTHIPRTKSELQLAEDMHAAEWRDRCMFQRLVTGIRERQAALESLERKQMMAQLHHKQAPMPMPPSKRRSKLRLSMQGAAVAAYAPAPMRQQQRAAEILPRADEILEESTYQSVTSSPAAAALPRREALPAVVSRQHLQDVLHRASGLADDALRSEDWSLGGYDEPREEEAIAPPAATQHQSYFMGPPPQAAPAKIEDEEEKPEDDDEMDGGIFSLDM